MLFVLGKFGERIGKDDHIISRVFHKINGSHPHLVDGLSKQLADKPPTRFKLLKQTADDLTNITNIHQLKEALQIAVKLEMVVMFEYLFACFSVINNSDESNPSLLMSPNIYPYLSELRREYKTQFMIICIEEMQHMSMAMDMLISIGGKPNVQQVAFPTDIGCDGAKADLIRLNLESLYMFAKNEEPYPDDKTPEEIIIPSDEENFVYYSIAQLYDAISHGFEAVHGIEGDAMFEVDETMTPMSKHYTQLQPVLDDIFVIETQGEGLQGGILFKAIIEAILDWIIGLGDKGDKQKKQEIIDLCKKILEELDDLDQLLQDISLLIELVEKFEKISGQVLPIGNKGFAGLKLLEPSHWARFLMMIMNYSMLNASSLMKDDKSSNFFSRPSYPRPDSVYHPVTQLFINLANSSYHLLLNIFEGTIMAIPPEQDEKFQITLRYRSIRFYPIMSILIYPLGEILSYFQLNLDKTNKTAGYPFAPIPEGPIEELETFLKDLGDISKEPAVGKFFNVSWRLRKLYQMSLQFDDNFLDKELPTCVGKWIDDCEIQAQIVKRVKYTLKHLLRSIKVLFIGFTNGLPLLSLQNPKSTSFTCEDQPQEKPVLEICNDKYYLNVEFDGYVMYSMATDYDPTYETRGFIGHQFMFEYSNDPDFSDEFFTQQHLLNNYPGEKKSSFKRQFVPSKNYEGVKVTSAKLVAPCYKTDEELREAKFFEMQEEIRKEFSVPLHTKPIDFCFHTMMIAGEEYVPKFQQLNMALSRQMGVDPVNVGFKTKNLDIKRANLLYTKSGEVVNYDSACIQYSDNFGVYSKITDPRTQKSGGYLEWCDTFNPINGLLANTNLMNTKCGAGQCPSDFYTLYQLRADKMMTDIQGILSNYKSDPLASLIIPFLKFFPETKLIVLALMVNIPEGDVKSKLSYLCTRYLQVKYLIANYFKNSPYQAFYHVPLNAPSDQNTENHLTAVNTGGGNLSRLEFITNQDWCVDFWVGAYDYDALTFYMTGSLNIPVHLKPPPT